MGAIMSGAASRFPASTADVSIVDRDNSGSGSLTKSHVSRPVDFR